MTSSMNSGSNRTRLPSVSTLTPPEASSSCRYSESLKSIPISSSIWREVWWRISIWSSLASSVGAK